MTTGRYAPSPSGRMHLGNLMCCLLAWLSAKSKGGQVLLRIEDLDAQRCPRRYADAIIDDLAWLGLAADAFGFESLFMHCWRLRERVLEAQPRHDLLRHFRGSGGVTVKVSDAVRILCKAFWLAKIV